MQNAAPGWPGRPGRARGAQLKTMGLVPTRVRSVGVVVVLSSVLAACSSNPSPSPGGPSGAPPAPTAAQGSSSASTPATAPSGGPGDIASLPRVVHPTEVLAGLLDTPLGPLDPDLAAIRDQLAPQIGNRLAGPIPPPPAFQEAKTWLAGGSSGNSLEVGFAIIEIAFMGSIMPSQAAADTVTSIVRDVGETPGVDVPDGPKQDSTEGHLDLDGTAGDYHSTGAVTIKTSAQQLRSQITVDLTRTLDMHVTSPNLNGTITTTIHSTESVDFCPDAGGQVPVHITSQFTLASPGSTVNATIDGTFIGQVDDTGALGSVTGEATIQGGTTASDGSTSHSYDLAASGLSFAVSAGTVGELSGGRYVGPADTQQLADDRMALAKIDLENALPTIFAAAEREWQNNACLIVEVPDYQYRAQPGSDNNPRTFVAPTSKSTFQIVVHQRFEHTDLNVPVEQRLSTEKSVDPQRVASTPGSASYTAPNKRDVSNDDDLRAWSRRGRSDLTIDFFTLNPPLKLSLNGTITEQAAIATVTGTIRVPVTEFTETAEGDHFEFEATVPVTVKVGLKVQGVPLACGSVAETERGTVHLQGRAVPIDDTHMVWQIRFDPSSAHFRSKSSCVIAVGNMLGGGAGFGSKFFTALGDFQVSTEPGTTRVTGSSAGAGISDAVSARVTVYAVHDPAQ
jgi:hypothetical protein